MKPNSLSNTSGMFATDIACFFANQLDLSLKIIDERERELCPLPKYVRDELEAYLRCGIHHYGFLRVRCPKGECCFEHAVPFVNHRSTPHI
jgi:hypothetical protein